MNLISISQDIPLSHYSLIIYLGASFSIVLFLANILHSKQTVKISSLYTLIFFSLFYWWAYSKADKFYSLDLTGRFLKISYVYPASDKLILITDIKTITFGSASRGGGTCYVSLNSFSGSTYRSTSIPERMEYCKNKRKELLSLLSIKKS